MSTAKMIEVLGRLRKNMNGEVAERMSAHGVDYALNYGVAIHTLKELARDYAPDTNFARLLYQQQVRDLQIMACYIANPNDISISDEEFWQQGVSTGEMAEQLSSLLAKSHDSALFVQKWLATDNPLLQYCALLTTAKNASATALQATSEYVVRGNEFDIQQQRVLATIISRHHQDIHITQALQYIRSSACGSLQQLNEEIFIDE